MDPIPASYEQLQSEIEDLRLRLEEAEETIRAIRSGEVDALVVSTAAGEQVYTLQGADYYYRVLIEAMSEGAVTLDPYGMVLYSNSRFAELVGTPLQKVIGASFKDFVMPGERKAFDGLLYQGLENSCRSEFTLLFAGGSEIPTLLSAYPLAMDPPVLCIIVSDQSERKRAMEALRESEARFRLLADNSSDLIARISLDDVYLYVSPACRTLLGYEPWEMVGRSPGEFIHPEDLAKARLSFHPSKEQQELANSIYRMRQKTGAYVWVETTGRKVCDLKGSANHEIQTDTRDITRRKQAEEQILEQNRILGWVNQISSALNESLNIGDILTTVQEHLHNTVGIPAGTIYLFNKEAGKLEAMGRWFDGETAGLALPLPRLRNHALEKTGVTYSLIKNHALPGVPDGRAWCRLQIPLMAQSQLLGLIDVALRVRPEAIQSRIEIIEMFGRELGIAIHNAQLYDAELKSRNLAETLRDANQVLARSLSLDSVLNAFLDVICNVVPYDSATIYLFENEASLVSRIERRAGWNEGRLKSLIPRRLAVENPFIQKLMAEKHSLAVADTSTGPEWDADASQLRTRSWACIPILADENVIAVCGLCKNEPDFYSADHLRWLDTLARQATVAIQNAWLFEQVRAGREKLQSLTRRLVEVQEKERRYVAQELHDDAGQALTSLIVRIGVLKQDVANPEAVKAHAAYLGEEAASVLENLRRLAMDLRPATLDHLGLVPALRQYSDLIAAQSNLNIQFEAIGLEKRLPDHTEVALYRIVQEALTNVIRHARASQVDILLERQEGRTMVMVEDNGIGFGSDAEQKPGHLGLIGMQERAEMLGGKLTIESRPGQGTTVLIEIPEVKDNAG